MHESWEIPGKESGGLCRCWTLCDLSVIAATYPRSYRKRYSKKRSRGGSLLPDVSSVLPRRWTPMQTMLQQWKRLGKTSLGTFVDMKNMRYI
jgi:hypothetical protein